MRYRQLGGSGLEVSSICLGTWGWPHVTCYTDGPVRADDGQGLKLLDTAVEGGVNFIDTADVYADGAAERMIGCWLRSINRRSVVVATKVGGRTWNGPNGEGASRKHIREACESSLRRLRTDYIDLYQVHSPDTATPIDETIAALDDLVATGKILYWGLSNHKVGSANAVARRAQQVGRSAPVSLQNRLNLLRCREAAQYDRLHHIGLLAYAPLAQGLLTEKHLSGTPHAATRVAREPALGARLQAWGGRLRALNAFARARGLTLLQLALAWVLHQPAASSAVIGVTDLCQLAENLAAAEVELTAEDLEEITQFVLNRLDCTLTERQRLS